MQNEELDWLKELNRREHERRDMERRCRERAISGQDVRKILDRCGYTTREFANHLRKIQAPIKTTRSVFRLMENIEIPRRYVDAIEEFVTTRHFLAVVAEIIREEERWSKARHRSASSNAANGSSNSWGDNRNGRGN